MTIYMQVVSVQALLAMFEAPPGSHHGSPHDDLKLRIIAVFVLLIVSLG
jgi:hypothetical protein